MVVYRLLGSATTDENGVASYTYTGHGSGEMDFIASTSNPIDESSLVSETYTVLDCYWIEKSSTTSGMYTVTGGTLTLNNGVFTLTKGSEASNFYLNIPKSSLPISDFLGKDLTVQTDITTMNATQLRMTLFYHNGSSWSQSVVKDIYDVGLMENTISIPSNSTQVRIRFDIYGDTDSQAVFKDFRILWG